MMGYLVRLPDGSFGLPGATPSARQIGQSQNVSELETALEKERAEQQDPSEHGPQLMADQQENELAQIIEPLRQDTYDNTLASVVGALVDRQGDMEQVVADFARHAHLDPDEAARNVGRVVELFQEQADSCLVKSGMQPDDIQNFYTFARDKMPDQLRNALLQFTMGRNPSALVAITEQYYRSNPPSEEAFIRAGWETKRHNGELLVRQGSGGWHSAAALASVGEV